MKQQQQAGSREEEEEEGKKKKERIRRKEEGKKKKKKKNSPSTAIGNDDSATLASLPHFPPFLKWGVLENVLEVPEEEKNLGPLDHLIHVRHCTKDPSPYQSGRIISPPMWFDHHWSFWEPFILRINEGETLAEVKVRINKKLQVPDDEFSKWKFKISLRGHLGISKEYLQDSDIMSSRFEKGRDIYEAWEKCQCLFLEHSDSVGAPKIADAANQKRLNSEQEEKEHKKAKAEAHLYTIIKQEKDEMLVPRSEYNESPQPMEVAQAEAFSAAPTINEVEVSLPTRQSGEITPSPEYPGAGQLYENGRHNQDVLDEKYEDIGGFNVLKTQASLYKKIWLKFGHIASSEVLTASSYCAQVTVVTDIMTSVMDMHQCQFAKVSSVMIDEWENKIKMGEKLEFNVKWLRERFEEIRKDYNGEQKHKTSLRELVQSLQEASARVNAVRDELKKAEENLSALQSRVSPVYFEGRIYESKGSRLLFDGLL
ncbi:hypothetical protein BVC80_8513g6 [Macleaya cordata]|uniref:ubiquitinyl hydrolase 1 n=1 Tax=Macleaya cordata TaxID=56857 RepID=A0A200QE14_MACCD|nr:hypothetical protein BVC80_8513g6 [Macleaya cordata]